MSHGEIIVLTDVAQITCIGQQGLADGVLESAPEAGVQGPPAY